MQKRLVPTLFCAIGRLAEGVANLESRFTQTIHHYGTGSLRSDDYLAKITMLSFIAYIVQPTCCIQEGCLGHRNVREAAE